MRTFLMIAAASVALVPVAVPAQEPGPLERAASLQMEGCRIRVTRQAQRLVRVTARCSSQEQARAALVQFRETARGQVFFGPLCSYTVAEPPAISSCEVQVEPRG